MAESTTATTTAAAAPGARPTKPDDDRFKNTLAVAQKEHDETMAKLKEVKAKIDVATGNKDNSPVAKRRQELQTELKEIRQKQGGAKDARVGKMDQVKRLDEKLRAILNEQKAAKGKVEFKSEADVDAEIQRLEEQVNSGTMKMVDERKALDNMSRYRKLKKTFFSQTASQQKDIDKLKVEIAEIKKSMDNPEAKALSERYTVVQTEFDSLKAQQDEAFKSLSSLRDERTRIQALQREQYEALKKIKDDHYAAKRAFKVFEDELWAKKRQRIKDQKDQEARDRKMARAKELLAEASHPAFLEEIRRAENLWHFFDPSHEVAEKKSLLAESGLRANSQRTVDDSAFKGMKAVRKGDEEELFAGVKKGKKGKKAHGGGGAAGTGDKFNCPPSIIEDCVFLSIAVPTAQGEVAATIEKIREKVDKWKADQEAQTQKNIERAKKEIEAIEKAEEAETNSSKVGVETTEKFQATSVDENKEDAGT